MSDSSIGVAVIGAGMACRAHINGYRAASTVFDSGLPEIRLVAIADAHEPFAVDAAKRYGYQRAETSWEAVAAAPDIDAVSVVVANHLHRPMSSACLGPTPGSGLSGLPLQFRPVSSMPREANTPR